MQKLSPATKQQLASAIIKEEKASQPSSSGKVVLKTAGRSLTVSTEALKPVAPAQPHSLFQGFQLESGCSNKSVLKYAQRYRDINGKDSIQPNLAASLVESGKVCEEHFKWEHFWWQMRKGWTQMGEIYHFSIFH